MRLNLEIERTLVAKIGDRDYPIAVSGKGIPCLAIGVGTLMQRTLSPRFKSHFEVYSSDLYWDRRHGLSNPSSLTMQQIIDDIAELVKSLQLSHYILFGHSAFGIVALEFAKQYPSDLRGIIMVGTPVNSNLDVAKRNDDYFQNYADPQRKEIDSERRAAFAKKDLTLLNPSEQFLSGYIERDAPRYWHDPNFDCTPLWEGILLDDAINYFFSDILPKIDVRKGLEQISCPIFLAAGMSDYDCCPWDWSEVQNLPLKMTISRFTESGHYPNYEEEPLFDTRLESWVGQ